MLLSRVLQHSCRISRASATLPFVGKDFRKQRRAPVLALAMATAGTTTQQTASLKIQGPGADKLRAAGCGGACSRDTPKVEPAALQSYMQALPAWQLNHEKTMLTRKFTAKNFVAAIRFFNQVAEVAEAEGHHPDLHVRNFREVEVNVYTHAVGGITMPDLVLAAKLDAIEVEYSPKWAKQEAERLAATAGGGGGGGGGSQGEAPATTS